MEWYCILNLFLRAFSIALINFELGLVMDAKVSKTFPSFPTIIL